MRIIITLCFVLLFCAGCGNNHIGAEDTPEQMLNKILKDCEITQDTKDVTFSIRDSNVITGQQNKIFIVNLAPKKNLVAVYTHKNGKYYFVGMVDTFMELEELQTMPLRGEISNLIVVRERAEQLLGAMEDGVYIRAYAYTGGKFNQVLSVIEDYKAYTLQGENEWKRVAQKARILWENEFYPVVNVLQNQNYAEAYQQEKKNATSIPPDSSFEIIKTRELKSRYQWSSKWKHFILAEGTNTANSKEVAIIADWSETPFGLVDEFYNQTERYLVKYTDGTLENIKKDIIKRREV